MIRGAQRNMIVVKTSDSELFEEAHFFVRREVSAKSFDLLTEADKIIRGDAEDRGEKKRRRCSISVGALIFSSGLVIGAFMMLLLVFFA